MATALPGSQNAVAGPSRASAPKQVTLRASSSDSDEDISPSPKANGTTPSKPTKRKHPVGNQSEAKRLHMNGSGGEEAARRRQVAAKLLETRKALPFYQGGFSVPR